MTPISAPGTPAQPPGPRPAAPSISCIVPAFNEGQSLPRLLGELSAELRQHF